MLASCASNVVLPNSENHRNIRMKKIKKIGDNWNQSHKISNKI